jgi:hypothetical protein
VSTEELGSAQAKELWLSLVVVGWDLMTGNVELTRRPEAERVASAIIDELHEMGQLDPEVSRVD